MQVLREGAVSHAAKFLDEVCETARRIPPDGIEALCAELVNLRDREGRLFIIGVGGSAGNCSHAVNDFRKLCGIEAYAPTDNVSELTARTNDDGWNTVFSEWLKVSSRRAEGRHPGIFGRWWQFRKERERQFGRRHSGGQSARHADFGHRRSRWRLYKKGWRCCGRHPDGGGFARDTARRSISSSDLALSRVTPEAAAKRYEMVRRRNLFGPDGDNANLERCRRQGYRRILHLACGRHEIERQGYRCHHRRRWAQCRQPRLSGLSHLNICELEQDLGEEGIVPSCLLELSAHGAL